MNIKHNVTETDCLKNKIETGDIVCYLISDSEENFYNAIVAAGVIIDIYDQGPMYGVWVEVNSNDEAGKAHHDIIRADECINLIKIDAQNGKNILKNHAARCHCKNRYDNDAAELSCWTD